MHYVLALVVNMTFVNQFFSTRISMSMLNGELLVSLILSQNPSFRALGLGVIARMTTQMGYMLISLNGRCFIELSECRDSEY
jgi:hypothetical protein